MKRSVGRAVRALGRVAIIGLAVGTGGLALVGPVGAQQQPAQQGQAAAPAGQQAQPLELRPGQNPFAVPARNAAPQQPFGAQPQQQVMPQPQQQAPQQAMQNPFAVPAQNAAPQQGASANCEKLVSLLTARRDMMNKINESTKKKQKMDAPTACALFTKLSANGSETVKWMAANKEWCRVPDQLVTNVKNDNEKVSNIRGQACKVAEQIEQMKKNGGQPGGLMGGSGLSGEMKIPSGAL